MAECTDPFSSDDSSGPDQIQLRGDGHERLGSSRGPLSQVIAGWRWSTSSRSALTSCRDAVQRKEIDMNDWEVIEVRCSKALLGGGGINRPVKF